jgi:hypothetical protein
MDPSKKLNDVRKAIETGLKYSLSLDDAGMSLIAYMKNRPIDVKNAYLKIVPYYVMKKPSEPSLITSAISCMALGPTSLFRISQSIQMLTKMKKMEKFQAVKEMRLEVDDEMKQ